MLLLIVSPLIALISVAAFSLSDVHNTFDFLVPLIGVAQLAFIIGIFLGKLWGLIGLSIIEIGLFVATLSYYIPKGEGNAVVKTLIGLSPLFLITIYHWTAKRAFFK